MGRTFAFQRQACRGPREVGYLTTEVVKGNSAIILALFIASVNIRWCLAQLPEILLGIILPRSVVNILKVRGSL